MAWPLIDKLVLRQRQLFAARHAQLPFDQILAGDLLGDRMLDLQPGVHFHEPDAVGAQASLASAMNSIVPAPS